MKETFEEENVDISLMGVLTRSLLTRSLKKPVENKTEKNANRDLLDQVKLVFFLFLYFSPSFFF